MRNLKAVKSLLLVGSVVGAWGLTAAFGTSTHSISIRARIPLVCNVSLAGGNSDFNAAGQASLGSSSEFCNSGAGYRVYARAEGIVDGASLVVDGVVFPLESGAEFVMATSSGPARTSRTIVFDAGETDGGGRLSLRIAAN